MRLAAKFVLLASVLAARAQPAARSASLWIRLDEPGKQSASITLLRLPPEGVGEVLAGAVGCRATDLKPQGFPAVECKPPEVVKGLSSTVHLPLSRLREKLRESDVDSVEIYITHSKGNGRITPAMDSTHGLFGWTHHAVVLIDDLRDISLETGYEDRDAWILGAGAAGLMLAPLLLFALRRSDILTIAAGVRVFSLLAGTAWLWIVFSTDAPGIVSIAASGLPGPRVLWQIAAVALPMFAAVGLSYFILGPIYERALPPAIASLTRSLLLTRGVIAASFVLTVTGLLAGGDSMITWSVAGLGGVFAGLFLRLRTVRGSVTPLLEGPLLARIRELADKGGAQIRNVHLFQGGSDTPLAFAMRGNAILLSQALVRDLSRDEVDAIVGHELSHLRRKHTRGIQAMFLILPMAVMGSFFVPGSLRWAPLAAPPVFLAFMAVRRAQEWTADRDGADWSGAEAFIRGLARVSQANRMPLSWGGWVRFALPHPPTIERLEAVAAAAKLPSGRVAELIAEVAQPASSRYELPPPAVPSDAVFSVARRNRLRCELGALAYFFPVAYGILAPLLVPAEWPGSVAMAAVELVCGIVLFYLTYEWILKRNRAAVRGDMSRKLADQGVTQPGEFVGFIPSVELPIYAGMYDLEWAFAALEGDRLVIRGDYGTFSATRQDIAKAWVHPGPQSWTPKPMVSFELSASGAEVSRGFSMRPFDGAFGPAAPGAARRLFDSFSAWRAGGSDGFGGQTAAPLSDYPNPQSQPNVAYPWRSLVKSWMQYAMYVFAGASFLQAYLTKDFDPFTMLTSVVLSLALLLFSSWPVLRR